MKLYTTEKKTHPYKLGIQGWGYAGKYQIERYLYTIHRLTGLGILLYLLMHIFVTSVKIYGKESWEAVMGFVDAPIFHLGEYILFVAVIFHAANGIRLIVTEFGYLLGKPQRPVYPYPRAMQRQRPLMIFLMVLTVLIIIGGGFDFFLMK